MGFTQDRVWSTVMLGWSRSSLSAIIYYGNYFIWYSRATEIHANFHSVNTFINILMQTHTMQLLHMMCFGKVEWQDHIFTWNTIFMLCVCNFWNSIIFPCFIIGQKVCTNNFQYLCLVLIGQFYHMYMDYTAIFLWSYRHLRPPLCLGHFLHGAQRKLGLGRNFQRSFMGNWGCRVCRRNSKVFPHTKAQPIPRRLHFAGDTKSGQDY